MAKKSHATNNFHNCQQRLRLTNKITSPDFFVELHYYNFQKTLPTGRDTTYEHRTITNT